MSRRKVSTTVYLEPEQAEALHALVARTSVPMAVWIRRGLDSVLAVMNPPPAETIASIDDRTVES